MNTSGKTPSNSAFKPPSTCLPYNSYTLSSDKTFAYRLNIRFPWLKLGVVLIIGAIMILDLLDLTISTSGDPFCKIRIAPMSHHVHATERDLNNKKLVALTFDDGPSATTTPEILKILTEKDARATFFVLGSKARNNSDIVKQAEKNGHDIASHTTYHQSLIRVSLSSAQNDINESKDIFQSILDHQPLYTRPPYGDTDSAVSAAIGTPIILWSVDTLDWKNKSTDSIVSTAMSEVRDGAIILMHDIYPTTAEALPILIDTLRNEGYEFATISELAEIRGTKLAAGSIYYNFP